MTQPANTDAGTILTLKHLGRSPPPRGCPYAADIYYLTYRSAGDGGSNQAAKLFVPVGPPPAAAGWPASVWCHGLGDPATQLGRWPLVAGDWRQTRGQMAGRWAHDGIVTLTPWLPGDGPSEPLGTYSPLSLDRNTQAVAAAFGVLHDLPRAFAAAAELSDRADTAPAIDLDRLVFRTDCVATPLLVHFAARWRTIPPAAGLKALVADDFQPSIAYNEFYLGPYLGRLPALAGAAMRCVWARLIWALAAERGWPLTEFFNPVAVEILSAPVATPIGPLPRMLGCQLVPPKRSQLAAIINAAVARDVGPAVTGIDIRNWFCVPGWIDMMSQPNLDALVRHPFYQRYFAQSDPFFAETTTPFEPSLPLLLVPRAGANAVNTRGLPGFSDRYQNMTRPKIETLRSWGWQIDVFPSQPNSGTSFAGGPAQRWTLDRLNQLLTES